VTIRFSSSGPDPIKRHYRIFQQTILVDTLCKSLVQEGLVGRIFQQSADKIRHPRQKATMGAIETHAAGFFQNRLPNGSGHSVKYLELVSIWRDIEAFCQFYYGAYAAKIV
jgi:hypothetical protein